MKHYFTSHETAYFLPRFSSNKKGFNGTYIGRYSKIWKSMSSNYFWNIFSRTVSINLKPFCSHSTFNGEINAYHCSKDKNSNLLKNSVWEKFVLE